MRASMQRPSGHALRSGRRWPPRRRARSSRSSGWPCMMSTIKGVPAHPSRRRTFIASIWGGPHAVRPGRGRRARSRGLRHRGGGAVARDGRDDRGSALARYADGPPCAPWTPTKADSVYQADEVRVLQHILFRLPSMPSRRRARRAEEGGAGDPGQDPRREGISASSPTS